MDNGKFSLALFITFAWSLAVCSIVLQQYRVICRPDACKPNE